MAEVVLRKGDEFLLPRGIPDAYLALLSLDVRGFRDQLDSERRLVLVLEA